MGIETYTDNIIVIHMVLFGCLILAGIVAIWRKIRGKRIRYWWLIPCTMYYSVCAVIGTFMASMAYDDPADPNFGRYGNWGLHDFLLHDLMRLILWILIGLLFYIAFERKDHEKAVRAIGTQVMIILTAVFAAFMIMMVWSFIVFLRMG